MLSEVPEGWGQCEFSELCSPKQYPAVPKSKFKQTGYPLYGANGQIGFYDSYTHEDKTIAITCRGATCGTINIVPPKSYITGNAMALDSLNLNKISFDFFAQYLRYTGVDDCITGSAQPQITRSSLLPITVTLPPLTEQKRIAEVLSSVDESIQATQRLIEQAERVKQGLMEELLTGGLGSEAIERGEVPEGWKKYKLKQLLRSIDGGVSVNSQSEPAMDNQLGILKTSCVSKGVFSLNENKVVVEEHEKSRLKEPVCKGTIIFSRMNTPKLVGANAYVPASCDRVFLPDRLWALKIDERDVIPRWLAYLLDYYFRIGVFELLGSGTSGSMKNISKAKLNDLELVLPNKNVQAKAVEALKSIDDTVQVQKSSLSQQMKTKKGLMDDLLTGKVRTV